MKHLPRILPAALLCLVAACTGAPTTMGGGAAMNSTCPISGKTIKADAPTVDYMGKKLALCCENCVEEWNGMDDAGKQAICAKAAK